MAKMENTQARCEQANQRCDELMVQQTQLQHDLDTERSRRAKSENVMNQALAETSELATQLGMLKEEKAWWSSHGVVSCFEYHRRLPHFSGLLDDMATVAYETGRHDGMHAAYLHRNRHELITEEFQAANASASNWMAETLSTAANDPLPEFQQVRDTTENPDPEIIRRLLDPSSPHVDAN
ncbi:hypothetical protein Hanom_Chr14g01273181 [Helianthus anomalus]